MGITVYVFGYRRIMDEDVRLVTLNNKTGVATANPVNGAFSANCRFALSLNT
jgi:hypothetical protein